MELGKSSTGTGKLKIEVGILQDLECWGSLSMQCLCFSNKQMMVRKREGLAGGGCDAVSEEFFSFWRPMMTEDNVEKWWVEESQMQRSDRFEDRLTADSVAI